MLRVNVQRDIVIVVLLVVCSNQRHEILLHLAIVEPSRRDAYHVSRGTLLASRKLGRNWPEFNLKIQFGAFVPETGSDPHVVFEI